MQLTNRKRRHRYFRMTRAQIALLVIMSVMNCAVLTAAAALIIDDPSTQFTNPPVTTYTATHTPAATFTSSPTTTPRSTITPRPTRTTRPTSTPTSTRRPTLRPTNSPTLFVFPTINRPNHPTGASAICRDGTYSYSRNRRGTCSHHGGVAVWLP